MTEAGMEIAFLVIAAIAGGGGASILSLRKRRSLERKLAQLSEDLATAKALPAPEHTSGLTPQDLLSQLATTWNLRSSQDQVLWTVFGTFWAANAILLVALFDGGKLPTERTVGAVISGVGFLMSGVWHAIQTRALGHIERYEVLAARLENRLDIPEVLSTSPRRNKVDYDLYVKGHFSARNIMPLCSALSAAVWLIALLLFVV